MDPLLAEIWAWVKVAAVAYGVLAAVILVVAIVFFVYLFRQIAKDF